MVDGAKISVSGLYTQNSELEKPHHLWHKIFFPKPVSDDQLSWDFVIPAEPAPKPSAPNIVPFASIRSVDFPSSPAATAQERKWYDMDDDDEIPPGMQPASVDTAKPAKEPPAASLDFETPAQDGAGDGLGAWRAAREEQLRALASKRGLPIGRMVELTMKHGPVIKGRLLLADETLWIDAEVTKVEQIVFRIDNLQLKAGDIESCVRLD